MKITIAEIAAGIVALVLVVDVFTRDQNGNIRNPLLTSNPIMAVGLVILTYLAIRFIAMRGK